MSYRRSDAKCCNSIHSLDYTISCSCAKIHIDDKVYSNRNFYIYLYIIRYIACVSSFLHGNTHAKCFISHLINPIFHRRARLSCLLCAFCNSRWKSKYCENALGNSISHAQYQLEKFQRFKNFHLFTCDYPKADYFKARKKRVGRFDPRFLFTFSFECVTFNQVNKRMIGIFCWNFRAMDSLAPRWNLICICFFIFLSDFKLFWIYNSKAASKRKVWRIMRNETKKNTLKLP